MLKYTLYRMAQFLEYGYGAKYIERMYRVFEVKSINAKHIIT